MTAPFEAVKAHLDPVWVRFHQNWAAVKRGGAEAGSTAHSPGGLRTKMKPLADAAGRAVRLSQTVYPAGDAPEGDPLMAKICPRHDPDRG